MSGSSPRHAARWRHVAFIARSLSSDACRGEPPGTVMELPGSPRAALLRAGHRRPGTSIIHDASAAVNGPAEIPVSFPARSTFGHCTVDRGCRRGFSPPCQSARQATLASRGDKSCVVAIGGVRRRRGRPGLPQTPDAGLVEHEAHVVHRGGHLFARELGGVLGVDAGRHGSPAESPMRSSSARSMPTSFGSHSAVPPRSAARRTASRRAPPVPGMSGL